ncbi:MAG: hypothetical protein Q4G03_07450 [Planctomycetia bacterium]|nr:hypothetical protein [Planctomycetia bacterium]
MTTKERIDSNETLRAALSGYREIKDILTRWIKPSFEWDGLDLERLGDHFKEQYAYYHDGAEWVDPDAADYDNVDDEDEAALLYTSAARAGLWALAGLDSLIARYSEEVADDYTSAIKTEKAALMALAYFYDDLREIVPYDDDGAEWVDDMATALYATRADLARHACADLWQIERLFATVDND